MARETSVRTLDPRTVCWPSRTIAEVATITGAGPHGSRALENKPLRHSDGCSPLGAGASRRESTVRCEPFFGVEVQTDVLPRARSRKLEAPASCAQRSTAIPATARGSTCEVLVP